MHWMYSLITVWLSWCVNRTDLLREKFDFISNYEIVRTQIIKSSGSQVELNLIDSNGRISFTLVLKDSSPNSSILSRELTSFTVHNASGVYKITNTIVYYHGYIEFRESDSYVHGTLYHDKAFEGVLKLPNVTFHLEAVDRRKPWPRDESILYEGCDTGGLDGQPFDSLTHSKNILENTFHFRTTAGLYRKYHPRSSGRINGFPRKKRAISKNVLTCAAQVVIDGYFTHYIAGGDRLEAAKFATQTIHLANQIFMSTDFDGDNHPDNVGIELSGLTFVDKIKTFNYFSEKKLAQVFLYNFTKSYHFPKSCVVLGLTYQDFGSILGMAWRGPQHRDSAYGIGGSNNHAIVTGLLAGKRIPSKRIQLTAVHEFGHSFGADHDSNVTEPICSPSYAQGGKYVMFPIAVDGRYPNNFIFSPCSEYEMGKLIILKKHIFSAYSKFYCGNGIVEGKEECDCGSPLSCFYVDQCCTPAGQPHECLLRRNLNAVCSPAVHSCCSADCQVMSDTTHACSDSRECLRTAYCDGESFTCPQPVALPDNSLCHSGTRLCKDGKCSKSVCEEAGLQNCYCQTINDECKLCCINTTSPTSLCKAAKDYPWFMENLLEVAEWLDTGSLCQNETGFCSTDHLCVKPGEDNFYLAGISLVGRNVGQWFDHYWYGTAVVIVIALVLLAVYYCTKEDSTKTNPDPFRFGNVMKVKVQTERLKRKLELQEHSIKESTVMFLRGREDVTIAITRLMLLFPLTSVDHIYKVMVHSANEAGAVKSLLLMGQPMRAHYTSHVHLQSEKKDIVVAGKANEQFEGKLMATAKDLMYLTVKERADLGITDPPPEQLTQMILDYQKKFVKKFNKSFHQPL